MPTQSSNFLVLKQTVPYTVFRIRISLNADPDSDPGFHLNADPDPDYGNRILDPKYRNSLKIFENLLNFFFISCIFILF